MSKEQSQNNKLQEYFEQSDIMKEEKALWAEFIPGMEPDDVTLLIKIFEKSPEKAGFLTQNLLGKIRAVASGDEESLRAILESEKALLTEN